MAEAWRRDERFPGSLIRPELAAKTMAMLHPPKSLGHPKGVIGMGIPHFGDILTDASLEQFCRCEFRRAWTGQGYLQALYGSYAGRIEGLGGPNHPRYSTVYRLHFYLFQTSQPARHSILKVTTVRQIPHPCSGCQKDAIAPFPDTEAEDFLRRSPSLVSTAKPPSASLLLDGSLPTGRRHCGEDAYAIDGGEEQRQPSRACVWNPVLDLALLVTWLLRAVRLIRARRQASRLAPVAGWL
ncbi:hypothetical protein MKZ38_006850 [Zalerion maritima]|uniref:Uncharacterized protein n=1 Tax=Zalerion maritima TaxID=339359 RepID=A0AAD5RJJ1_9PEZI|nr:hypothetical protein MKZ38_006850 [Zalerion maritima]